MRTLMTLWVWTSPGLALEPLRSLHLVVRLLVHPMLAWMVAKVTFCFLFFISALFYIWSFLILFAIPGASDSKISGWADVLEAVYKDIGGCSSYIPYCITFCLTFLTLKFAARPPLPPSEEHGLLQVAVDELGATVRGMFYFCVLSTVILACYG